MLDYPEFLLRIYLNIQVLFLFDHYPSSTKSKYYSSQTHQINLFTDVNASA
jgi:hypothetical protein